MDATDPVAELALATERHISSKPKPEQVKLLLWVCHYLSTAARGYYGDNQPVTVLGETQLGAINECQNRILGYVLALLLGTDKYPLTVLMNDVFRQAHGAGVGTQKLYELVVRNSFDS